MPNNWKTYKLGELGDIKGGKRLPKGEALVTTKTKHPYIRVTDMGTRTIPIEKLQYVPNDVFPKISRYIVNKNDLILSIVGTVGSVSIIDEKLDNASLTENCVKITNLKNIDSEYLYYFLISDIGQFEIVKGIVGSTQPKLPIYNINNLDISLPSLQEQKSIASILSAIDDKIENNLAINKTLEEMAMALYKHWFIDFGPFQEGEFVESELGRIPMGWEVKRLDEIITVKRGGSPRPIQDFLASEGLPWVKISDATASNSPYLMDTKEFIKEEGLRKTVLLKKGSLILSNSASPGIPRFLELDACIHDGWLHFPEINRFGKYLLYLTFLRIKEELIQKGNGSVFTNLKTDILKSQLVTLPPLDIEQKINSQIKSYFKQIRNNCIENQTLTQLRDTLLPKLISGEVRLKEFVSSDK